METIHENELAAAQANVALAQAIANARGDMRNVNLDEDVLLQVTELVYPDGIRFNVGGDGWMGSVVHRKSALANLPNLRKLVISDPETVLPGYYFSYMTSPNAEIQLPMAVVKNKMFAYSKIKSVTLTAGPADNGSFPKDYSQADYAFQYTVGERAEIAEGVKDIPKGIFRGTRIENITLPSTIQSIWHSAFYQTNFKDVQLPPSCASIGPYAFSRSDVEEINLENVRQIGDYAFCESCVRQARLNCEEIGIGAFRNCKRLVRVEFGPAVRHIHSIAFNQSALRTVTIPANVKALETDSFTEMHDLASVSIANPDLNIFAGHGDFIYPFKVSSGLKIVQLDFQTARPLDFYMRRMGLNNTQIGANPGCNGTVKCISHSAGPAWATSAMGKLAAKFIGLGFNVKSNNTTLYAETPELDVGMANDVTAIIAGAGQFVGVAFADENRVPLSDVTDLSQIKTIIIKRETGR